MVTTNDLLSPRPRMSSELSTEKKSFGTFPTIYCFERREKFSSSLWLRHSPDCQRLQCCTRTRLDCVRTKRPPTSPEGTGWRLARPPQWIGQWRRPKRDPDGRPKLSPKRRDMSLSTRTLPQFLNPRAWWEKGKCVNKSQSCVLKCQSRSPTTGERVKRHKRSWLASQQSRVCLPQNTQRSPSWPFLQSRLGNVQASNLNSI